MASEAQRRAIVRYDRMNTVQFKLKLNLRKDMDLIQYLRNLENKQGTIKALLRRDMYEQEYMRKGRNQVLQEMIDAGLSRARARK